MGCRGVMLPVDPAATPAGPVVRPKTPARGGSVTRHAALILVGTCMLAGCAPPSRPQLPRLDSPAVAERFMARLAERRTRAVIAEGDYSVWVRSAAAKRPPAFTVRARLVAPTAFRLRVDALFGNAVDIRGHGDTLVIDAPALGITAVTDAAGDRSRRQDVAGWVCRALGATWTPPAAAWGMGAAEDSAWRVRWTDAEDSLQMVVSRTGLPRSVSVHPRGGTPITLTYERWASWNGVMWPARVVGRDADGRLSVTMQSESLLLKSSDALMNSPLRVPQGAVRLSRARLMSWVARMAAMAAPDSATEGTP